MPCHFRSARVVETVREPRALLQKRRCQRWGTTHLPMAKGSYQSPHERIFSDGVSVKGSFSWCSACRLRALDLCLAMLEVARVIWPRCPFGVHAVQGRAIPHINACALGALLPFARNGRNRPLRSQLRLTNSSLCKNLTHTPPVQTTLRPRRFIAISSYARANFGNSMDNPLVAISRSGSKRNSSYFPPSRHRMKKLAASPQCRHEHQPKQSAADGFTSLA